MANHPPVPERRAPSTSPRLRNKRDPVPDPSERVRAAGGQDGHQGQGTRTWNARLDSDQAAVLRATRRAGRTRRGGGRAAHQAGAQGAGLHRRKQVRTGIKLTLIQRARPGRRDQGTSRCRQRHPGGTTTRTSAVRDADAARAGRSSTSSSRRRRSPTRSTRSSRRTGRVRELAKKYSIDTSRPGGRRVAGGGVKGRFVKEFEDVAFKSRRADPGARSTPGWARQIIEATGPIKPPTKAKPTPLSQVKEAIRQTCSRPSAARRRRIGRRTWSRTATR